MARIEAEMNANTDHDQVPFISHQRHLWALLKRLLALGLLSVSSLMAAKKLSADLQGLPPAASVNVIIQFTRSPTSTDLRAVSQAGGVLKQTFQGIHGAAFKIKAGQLNAAASNATVAYISPD